MQVVSTYVNSYPADRLVYVEFEGKDGEMVLVRLKPQKAADPELTIEKAREIIAEVAAQDDAPLTPEARRAMWKSYLEQMRAAEVREKKRLRAANQMIPKL